MIVLRKNPGQDFESIDIPNTLEALQKEVEGYIEVVPIGNDAVIICNEEGRLIGLPYNTQVGDYSFVGTILIAGTNGEELTDYTGEAFA